MAEPAGGGVEELALAETYDLRRRVLRAGTPSADVHFPEDEWPGTLHLGRRDASGAVVAVTTLCAKPTVWRPGRRAVQLRGMAVDPALQRRGLGRALLAEAMARLQADGVEVLWADARDSALAFYAELGLLPVGDGFVTAATGLAHHTVLADLA